MCVCVRVCVCVFVPVLLYCCTVVLLCVQVYTDNLPIRSYFGDHTDVLMCFVYHVFPLRICMCM